MAFVASVSIPISIPMTRFQCRGLQMARIDEVLNLRGKSHYAELVLQ